MEFISYILIAAVYPLLRLITPSDQFFILSFVGSAFIAVGFYFWSRRHRKTTMRGLWRYMVPRKLYRHASTIVDLKIFIFISIYFIIQTLVLLSLAPEVRDIISAAMSSTFGDPANIAAPIVVIGILIVTFDLLAVEFGYWYGHYLLHRVPWLWEFHKVHHSAEVLTPLTEWRQHPVELFLVPMIISLATGVVHGIAGWVFGDSAAMIKLWNVNIALLFFGYTLLHLRHTHVKLAATGFLGKLIQSPAHHQVHHSADPKHHDKNLGLYLSVWDWAFGTLFIPEKNQKLEFGLDEKDEAFETLTGSMVEPVKRAAVVVSPKPAGEATADPVQPSTS
ncbi:MAG: sterol desaturase family protein [Marinicaulis sp.]|nr:sterol desaturase family protein [Marinicaulis sp.]NNL88548.1 sterol desaturase family protein [Marinicaulis sp.]